MTLQAQIFQSDEVRSPSTKGKSTPIHTDKEVYTHEEVFGDIVIGPFSLEDALDILEISEAAFQKELDSRGFCPKEDFDRKGKFPVGWISALDTMKWMVN